MMPNNAGTPVQPNIATADALDCQVIAYALLRQYSAAAIYLA